MKKFNLLNNIKRYTVLENCIIDNDMEVIIEKETFKYLEAIFNANINKVYNDLVEQFQNTRKDNGSELLQEAYQLMEQYKPYKDTYKLDGNPVINKEEPMLVAVEAFYIAESIYFAVNSYVNYKEYIIKEENKIGIKVFGPEFEKLKNKKKYKGMI